MNAKKVFCYGELLLRMSPQLEGQWIKQAQMSVYVGGAELNVAQALSQWGIPVAYCTALPDNYLSQEIIDSIQQKKIDTSAIIKTGDRIGAYFLPQGADLKNAGVIYDRAHSSFAGLLPGTINWEELLTGCEWFHFSAISPALNEQAAAVCLEAVKAADKLGMTISVDLNYRAKLWQYEKKPPEIMSALLPYCDVVMGNSWAAQSLLGVPSPLQDSRGHGDEQLEKAAYESMGAVRKQFPRASIFAYTYRLEKEYWAVLQKEKEQVRSVAFAMDNPVDKVGSGDCFMGGLIYGMLHEHSAKEIINFAAAAAVGKLYEKGDATRQTVADVMQRLQTHKK